ncbi:MAG: hypothetical protein NTU41_10485 [Chloroflexi bacterium]|nr:hypothetical protein [Chloroflexota bacterium]
MIEDFPFIHGHQKRADAFHLATLSEGGLFDFDASTPQTQYDFKEAIRGISELIKRWYEFPHCRKFLDVLHAGFVVNSEPNAFSQSATALNLIGIYSGLVWVINEMWATLLCHNDFLPDIEHNSSFESRLRNGIFVTDGFEGISDYEMQWRGHPWAYLSPWRLAIATVLSAMSVEYVFYHEIAHLLLGHSKYIAAKTGASLHELERRRRNIPLPPYELQGLEFEADGVATCIALGSSAMLGHFSDEKARDPSWMLSFYYVWGLSVEGVFRLFSQSTWDLSAYQISTHPHPFARSYGNWLNVLGNSSLEHQPLRERILNEYAKAVTDLARYWHKFRMPGYDSDPINDPDLWLTHNGYKLAGDLLVRAGRSLHDTLDERAKFELPEITNAFTFGSDVLHTLIKAEQDRLGAG